MAARIQIERATHALRAVMYGDDDCIQDIIETDDPDAMAEILFDRGWRGTGFQMFWQEVELDVGELSLTEELEIAWLSEN
ncbi:MAG: hypothetical protein LC650_03055 [Actinobacteria bacterium]|nr:hypothetical protein [Actinomycetota bacterium]